MGTSRRDSVVTRDMEITEMEDAPALPGQVVITLYYTVYSTHVHSVHSDPQHGDHGEGGCTSSSRTGRHY